VHTRNKPRPVKCSPRLHRIAQLVSDESRSACCRAVVSGQRPKCVLVAHSLRQSLTYIGSARGTDDGALAVARSVKQLISERAPPTLAADARSLGWHDQ